MSQLFTLPFVPALSLQGLFMGASTLTFYLTGTTTPATVYGDKALTNPLGSVITANAYGRFPNIYLADDFAYRVILTDRFGSVIGDVELSGGSGVYSFEAFGVVPNDATKAVSNVNALRGAMLGMAIVGGTLTAGPGKFYFDTAALGMTGIQIPSNTVIQGSGPATVLAVTNQVPGYQVGTSTAPGMLFTTATGTVNAWIENCEIRGLVRMTGGRDVGARNCTFTGCLTSKAQYGETGFSFVAGMATGSCTYRDTTTDTATDIGTTPTPFADTTVALSGNVLSITPTMTTQLGYTRYVVSDYLALDPTKFYIVRFLNGFYSGDGACSPMFSVYNASKVAFDMGQFITPSNTYVPNEPNQNGTITAVIGNASFVRLSVGVYKDAKGLTGQTANFDLSKIQILEVTNDYRAWLQHIFAQVAGGAGLGQIDSPANFRQLELVNCVNSLVYDCDFQMIDRGGVGLTNCTGTHVIGCGGEYLMQGSTDTGGVNCHMNLNNWDLGTLTTSTLAAVIAGTLTEEAGKIGSRAFRLRGIGGSNCDRGQAKFNTILRASWGMEIIPFSLDRSYTIEGNYVEAEFAAASLYQGYFSVDRLVARVSGDCRHGIECPGAADNQRALITNPDIRWLDFTGCEGVGISSTDGLEVTVMGGFIRAPLIAQSIGTANISMTMLGTKVEYGWAAYFNRGGASLIKLASAKPWVKTVFPRRTGAGINGVLNIAPVASAARQDLEIGTVDPGINQVATITGVDSFRLCLPDVVTPRNALPASYILISPSGNASAYDLDRINFRALPSSAFTSSWASLSSAPTTGSRITMRGCRVNQLPAQPPGGTYPRSMLTGDPWEVVFDSGVTIGTVAAGAKVDITGLNVPGAAVGFVHCTVDTTTIDGFAGLIGTAFATADDTVTVRFLNGTSAAITPPSPQTLIVLARPIR